MIVGVPREIKEAERRVSVTPAGVGEYVARGQTVLVERSAGAGSGFGDDRYATAGSELVASPDEVFRRAEMIVEGKESIATDDARLRPGPLLFTFLDLATERALPEALLASGVKEAANETVRSDAGECSLLSPMSGVAGRRVIQVGPSTLTSNKGGGGQLLQGVSGGPPASSVVGGGGEVGSNGARLASGIGANVTMVDRNVERFSDLGQTWPGPLTTLAATEGATADAVVDTDLKSGVVPVAGANAPTLVTRAMISSMRPGSVVVDVAIDQGGCIETARPTTHSAPTFLVDGVIHCGVTSMPGAVPRTSTLALQNVWLPHGLALADLGIWEGCGRDAALARGVNVVEGKVAHRGVATALGVDYTPVKEVRHQEETVAVGSTR